MEGAATAVAVMAPVVVGWVGGPREAMAARLVAEGFAAARVAA